MVGSPAAQQAAASARGSMAAAVAPGGCWLAVSTDPRPVLPHPPGRVTADRTHAPPGVQQGELHGAGWTDVTVGKKRSNRSIELYLEDQESTLLSQ